MGADVETTGLGRSDEVVEFAIALFAFDLSSGSAMEIVDHFSGLREPSCAIDPGAQAVHGITATQLRGKRLDAAAVERILGQADILVAHKASFDGRFVTRLFPATRGMKWHCSMNGIDWYGKGFASRGLQELLRAHGVRAERAHRALDDVVKAVNLLVHVDGVTGRPYLAELLEGRGAASRGRAKDERAAQPRARRKGGAGKTLKVIGFVAAVFSVLGLCGLLVANGGLGFGRQARACGVLRTVYLYLLWVAASNSDPFVATTFDNRRIQRHQSSRLQERKVEALSFFREALRFLFGAL